MKHIILIILLTIGVWAQEVGVPFAILNGNKTTALASTKDGKMIFSATTGTLHRIELDPIKVSFSVSVGNDVTRRMVYPLNAKPYQTMMSQRTNINSIAISPNEQFIVTCGSDKLLKAWDAQNGKLLQTFVGHDSPVKGAVILPDDKTLISGDENMTIKYWDISSGKEIKSFTIDSKIFSYHPEPAILHDLYLSDDGKILIVYDSHYVEFFDVKEGKRIASFTHKSPFNENASYFHNDILYVLMGGFVLEYDVGKFSQLKEPTHRDIITIDPKKDFKNDQSEAIRYSCITDENDILTILIHMHSSQTSAPLVMDKLKVYGGKSGEIIIDQCPVNNNQMIIKPMGTNWLAITTDGYFDATEAAREDIYITNVFGKAIPLDDETYQKYHKTLKVEKK